MSLQAGRVGVRNDQVDVYGRVNPKSDFIVNLLKDLPAWTDLPVWYRGTEQLLPVNDDDPETSPILCDIEYPIADLKNNQYFTYRQSPTHKDGKAKIRGIRGKTLVWNQLQNGISATTTSNGVTFTKTDNTKLTLSGTSTQGVTRRFNSDYSMPIVSGHKYLLRSSHADVSGIRLALYQSDWTSSINTNGLADEIVTATMTSVKARFCVQINAADIVTDGIVLIPQVFDLTTIFGAGNEPTVEQFKALFPLPYYKYNTGSLLDFTGTKIKTVGCNQANREDVELGGINSSGVEITDSNNARSSVYIPIMPNTKYVFSTYKDFSVFRVYFYDENKTFISPRLEGNNASNIKFTTPKNAYYLRWTVYKTSITLDDVKTKRLQLEFGENETPFTEYVSNETELPTSTFFPTGMKSAGAVYDELKPTRAITRVGSFTFDGTEDWVMESQGDGAKNFFIRSTSTRPDDAKKSTYNGIVASKDFHWRSSASDLTNVVYSGQSTGLVQVRVASDFISNIDATKWKTYLTSNPITIHYELAVEDVQPTMSFDTE